MKHSLLFLRAVLTLPLAFELAPMPMPAVPDRQSLTGHLGFKASVQSLGARSRSATNRLEGRNH